MLPFADISFYFLALAVVLLLHTFKKIWQKIIPYEYFIFSISVIFALFLYPKPFHLAGFVLYSYLVLQLLVLKFPQAHRLIGSMIIALPLLLIKTKSLHGWLEFAGASYMTFRTIQVYIDYDSLKKDLTFSRFVSFLLFIPTLLVGPIDRFSRFVEDVKQDYQQVNTSVMLSGWNFILLGLVQKYVMAEVVFRYWLNPLDASSTEFMVMSNNAVAYSVFLYFDFAGYSHLAMGLGYLLGVKVPDNFDQPYLSKNPQEFWKRWHISLGDWLRDYFFRPIYKELSSRQSLKTWPLLRQNVALFMTFFLMGCWNGFKSYYILSGAVLGLYSVIHNSYNHYSRKYDKDVFAQLPEGWSVWISRVLMFVFVCFALYLFSGRFPYLNH